MKNRALILAFLWFAIMLSAGCGSLPQKVVIGMVPYDNPVQAEENFKPIKNFLEKEMGTSIEFMVTSDYLGLIRAMKEKKVDIGWYGPFSYVAGEHELKLEPLVVQFRKGSGIHYFSQIIARKDSGIKTPEDLKGKRFVFVDPGSTSGFVIPFTLFKSRDIDVNHYFNQISYSGSHDAVAMDVLNKKVDAGAMDDIVYNSMVDSGKLMDSDMAIVWKSDAIPGSPYVARADLDKRVKDKFKAAMLSIHEKDTKALQLHDSRVEKFVECNSALYNGIRNKAKILGEEFVIEKFLKKK